MGGISTSTLRQVEGEPFASWSGVCRVDGGGFVGVRTLPFREKLQAPLAAEGFYFKCRMASDRDTDKRVWKITTRLDESRGEQLYQAMFSIPSELIDDDWATIQIPFSDFTLVRGARKVKDGKPFNVSDGIYQIGFTMSKFKIGENMTELEGFRPGFFDLHMREIGFYTLTQRTLNLGDDFPAVQALSKAEAAEKRPLLLKMLLPLSKLFFTEQSQRRKSAMKKLKKRGYSRLQAIIWGVKIRAQKQNIARAFLGAVQIVTADVLRLLSGSILRYGIFLPLRYVQKAVAATKKLFIQQSQKLQ
jgi:hypothetical protein